MRMCGTETMGCLRLAVHTAGFTWNHVDHLGFVVGSKSSRTDLGAHAATTYNHGITGATWSLQGPLPGMVVVCFPGPGCCSLSPDSKTKCHPKQSPHIYQHMWAEKKKAFTYFNVTSLVSLFPRICSNLCS